MPDKCSKCVFWHNKEDPDESCDVGFASDGDDEACPMFEQDKEEMAPIIPTIDWNKQGELLAELERQGGGKGARERAKGNPRWLRRSDYPSGL